MRRQEITIQSISLIVFCAVYSALVFPFAYFRHDDWMNLGNGALLQGHWERLWNAQLVFSEGPRPWFFRPFFLLDNLLFFKAFGLHYYPWLLGTLGLTAAAIALGAAALRAAGSESRAADFFVVILVASVPLHFANLVWAGEGLMNCPQIFLLALSLYFFCRGAHRENRLSLAVGLGAYALALGFKESTIFHTAFLLGVVCEPVWNKFTVRRRIFLLAPYAVLTAAYLVFRLGYLPLNGDYAPHMHWWNTARPLGIFLLFLGLPAAVWWLAARWQAPERISRETGAHFLQKWRYLPFAALSIAPHLAHQFFSPGWLLYPGFFCLLALCFHLPAPALNWDWKRKMVPALCALSALPVLYQLHTLQWWRWEQGQKEFTRLLERLPADSVNELRVYNCQTDPKLSFQRVVGHDDSVYHLWMILHPGKPVIAHVVSCTVLESEQAIPTPGRVSFRWDFPGVTVLPGQIPKAEEVTLK